MSNEQNKGGRPKKRFNKKEFEKLCKMLCTKNEICSFFECDEKTLTRWCKEKYEMGFSDAYKILSVHGKISIRRLQFSSAKKGNVAMQIFLGKQLLNQKDNPELVKIQKDKLALDKKKFEFEKEQKKKDTGTAGIIESLQAVKTLADYINDPKPNRSLDDE